MYKQVGGMVNAAKRQKARLTGSKNDRGQDQTAAEGFAGITSVTYDGAT